MWGRGVAWGKGVCIGSTMHRGWVGDVIWIHTAPQVDSGFGEQTFKTFPCLPSPSSLPEVIFAPRRNFHRILEEQV